MSTRSKPAKLPQRPLPEDQDEQSRIKEQARRRRILTGRWDQDVEIWMRDHFGDVRRKVMGPKDKSTNFLVSITKQTATLYDNTPAILHPSGLLPELLGEWLEYQTSDGQTRRVRRQGRLGSSGLFSALPRVQQHTLGVNEAALAMEWSPRYGGSWEAGQVRFRQVDVDLVEAESDPSDPGRPILWKELRQREIKGEVVWTQDVHDIRDPEAPSFRVLRYDREGKKSIDITGDVHGAAMAELGVSSFSGAAYPTRYTQGELEGLPFIPVALYHRQHPATLWNPWEHVEAVDGTLTLAVLWSFWAHAVKNGSFRRPYVAGGRVVPLQTYTDATGKVIEQHASDPAAVMEIEQHETAQQLLVGEWSGSMDPAVLGEAIASYEARLASSMGVDPSDIQRLSGDPRSGYALAISQAAKQEARRRFAPVFRPIDEELVGKAAAMINANAGTSFPESGFVVDYELVDPVPGVSVNASTAPPIPAPEPAE